MVSKSGCKYSISFREFARSVNSLCIPAPSGPGLIKATKATMSSNLLGLRLRDTD